MRGIEELEKGLKPTVTGFHGTFLLLQFKLRKQYKEPRWASFFPHAMRGITLFFIVCSHQPDEWPQNNTMKLQFSQRSFHKDFCLQYCLKVDFKTPFFCQCCLIHSLKRKHAAICNIQKVYNRNIDFQCPLLQHLYSVSIWTLHFIACL